LPLAPAIEAQQQRSSSFALSPDGGRLVYVARQGNTTALYLRDLATGEARLLPDTADAYAPFFSPDGASVGFAAGDRLRTLQLSAPLARDLTPTERDSRRVTADWAPSGDVVFAEPRGLAQVRSDGGPAALVVTLLPSESGFLTPRVLPDGRHLLAAVRGKTSTKTDDASQITIVDTVTHTHHVLIDQGGSPVLLRSGTDARAPAFLIYARGGRLWAATFDLARLAIAGAPQPVVDNVEMRPNGDGAQFAVSTDGTLAYLEASPMELAWVDRRGAATPVSALMRRFAMPRLAPDGRRLAVEVQDTPHQIWVLDTEHDLLTPFTGGPGGNHDFAWSADGRGMAFTASTGAAASVMWMPLDGPHVPQTIIPAGEGGAPWIENWSRDGRWMAIVRRAKGVAELQLVPLEPGSPPRIAGAPKTIARLGEGGLAPDFSPDGQWVAWCECSPTLTQATIYVSRVSDGRRYQVGEGFEPRWSVSGRELFFRDGRSMMAVDVTLGPEVTSGRPHKLFDGDYLAWGSADYDVARDGRFVMVRPAAASARGRKLSVRLNWIAELNKLQF
jgi:Tol biopolymer transport system component